MKQVPRKQSHIVKGDSCDTDVETSLFAAHQLCDMAMLLQGGHRVSAACTLSLLMLWQLLHAAVGNVSCKADTMQALPKGSLKSPMI